MSTENECPNCAALKLQLGQLELSYKILADALELIAERDRQEILKRLEEGRLPEPAALPPNGG